ADGGFGFSGSSEAAAAVEGQTRNFGGASVFGQARRRPDCPECHPSVYSYCGDRLLHDACCCLRDSQPLPPQCNLADCSFLHSKSCYEHNLITRCCCDRRLF
ncbi:uncharacterized protein LOC117644025, partial [Thrips palmi]|uniref:Uncharacterized protein LOC117644025 n=1 Tax=Thrips palmi TaxID=161013 RepID=A0A6P8YH70_THRPL